MPPGLRALALPVYRIACTFAPCNLNADGRCTVLRMHSGPVVWTIIKVYLFIYLRDIRPSFLRDRVEGGLEAPEIRQALQVA